MNKDSSIYYVGIGASAGGLEALEDFFKAMPDDSGMVFIVVQHLSPDYRSMMDELLARHTKMPINIVKDGMETEVNNIYLIPPKNNLLIFHGKLYLEEYKDRKRINLPVDVFFRSLAIDQEKNAIGIILSGTGSDGTLGVRAIKEAGGMVMVQDEQSAKFDGMPRNSIATGLVDYILTPAKMAEELLNYIKHPLVTKASPSEHILKKDIDTLAKIILILRDYCGTDFSYYKENTILRRLERRVSINRFTTLEEYLSFLFESDKEKETLYRELLIGVTRFFRDHEAFTAIEEKVLPLLDYNKKIIRVWSAGCSTGEEVYSLSMMLHEYIERKAPECEIKIFATDIDRHALDIASQGYYPDSILADVEPGLLMKYFHRKDNGYQVSEKLRKSIVFASHNLLKDPPFSKLDILVCRNLFIYFKPEVQQKILSMFYYSLKPDGFMFMGSSESLGDMSDAFETIDTKWKIFRYKDGFQSTMVRDLPALRSYSAGRLEHNGAGQDNVMRLDKLFESALMSVLPPAVLVDQQDHIIQIINDVSDYITIKSGRFSNNILDNVSKELSLYINNMLRRLKEKEVEIEFKNVSINKDSKLHRIQLEGYAVNYERTRYFLICFRELPASVEKQLISGKYAEGTELPASEAQELTERIAQLERELKATEESLQATIEELETSNEELQSSNEELISSNEELQSTNEELQSVNEELYTVNTEYQSKIQELNKLNNDMDNLLKNTEVGALYLDRNLCIRKLTPVISKITNIMQSDIGRPIAHISFMTGDNNLIDDIIKVAEDLQSIERELKDDKGNNWLTKIRPYRTEHNAVEGVMVTFTDVNTLRAERDRIQQIRERLEQALDIGHMAWWEWDVPSGEVIFEDKKATMIGYTPQEFPSNIYGICNLLHPDDYEDTMQIMRDHLEGRREYWECTYRIKAKTGGYSWYYDRGQIVERTAQGEPLKLVGTVVDVTEMKTVEYYLKQNRQLFRHILEDMPVATTMVSAESGIISYANKAALVLFEIDSKEALNRSFDDQKWQITDLHGAAIPVEELPFVLVKKNKKPVIGYKHYIVSGERKKLLTMDGVPIYSSDGVVEGAIFTIREVKQ